MLTVVVGIIKVIIGIFALVFGGTMIAKGNDNIRS